MIPLETLEPIAASGLFSAAGLLILFPALGALILLGAGRTIGRSGPLLACLMVAASFVLGLGLFVIPLGFVANPSLLYLADQTGWALLAGAKLAAGIWLMSHGVIRESAASWKSWAAFLAGAVVTFAFGI